MVIKTLKKQSKRGNKTMENIKVNKSDCKMGTMSVRELMEIPNVIKTDTTHNPTDGVLPIQRLINNGDSVLLNEEGKVVVMVGESENCMEGICSHRDEDLDKLQTHYVDVEDITDYNSLWEMLECGWDTPPSNKGEVQYPYISVNGKWWRWDNSPLRMDMGIYHWNTENQQKFLGSIITNQPQTPQIIIPKVKIGRNEKCGCGSGKKFKKCHMNLEVN